MVQSQLVAPLAEAKCLDSAGEASDHGNLEGSRFQCATESARPEAIRRSDVRSLPGGRAPPEVLPASAGLAATLLHEAANRGLALLLLLVSLPFFLPIGLAVLVGSGWPIFYGGARLGRHRRPFTMYKFRTLVNGAHRAIGGRMLARGDDLVTPVGWFLRDTRLDELPQLLNIIKGDMAFVGPRPERPEVAESLCSGIAIYGSRFDIKPGLVGYSQLFTPHSTPKRIRALIDDRLIGRQARPLLDLLLVGYTAAVVAGASALRLLRYAGRVLTSGRTRWTNQRRLPRVHPRRAAVIIHFDDGWTRCRAPVIDINESAFVMVCGEPLRTPTPRRFELIIRVGRNGRSRRFSALCRGQVAQVRSAGPGYAYVVTFEPVTDRSLYVVHQHFLRRSLAPARA